MVSRISMKGFHHLVPPDTYGQPTNSCKEAGAAFRATILVGLLAGCGPMADVAHDAPPPAAVLTSSPAGSATSRSASSGAPSASAAAPSSVAARSASAAAPPPVEAAFTAQQIRSLTDQLRDRRVFRHVLLGELPAPRERHSWLLSKDGRRLTLICECDDRTIRVESPRPDQMRWFLVASASYLATEVPTGQTWAPLYQRDELTAQTRRLPTLCEDVGEQIAMVCRLDKLQVLRPNAYVTSENRSDAAVRWQPSARRPIAGLSCSVTAAKAVDFTFDFYDFPPTAVRPMLFFSDDGTGIERLVNNDALEYADFREAVLASFDGRLPRYLIDPQP